MARGQIDQRPEHLRKKLLTQAGNLVVHGFSAYQNHGCRCTTCREKWRRYHRAYLHESGRARPLAEHLASIFPDHGSLTRYLKYGCRCETCMAASREKRARERLKAAGVEGTPCPDCGRMFNGPKGVNIHRKKGTCR